VLLYRAVACPYFYPLSRFESSTWVVPPRLPLGDPFSGECRAEASPFQPEETQVRQVCNLGYGRGCCERFPDSSTADAVRFHVSKHTSKLIRIQYIFEKDCWPKEHGVLEWANAAVSSGPENEVLRRQAAAFLESYLRRRT
jgi:hypothetical protein